MSTLCQGLVLLINLTYFCAGYNLYLRGRLQFEEGKFRAKLFILSGNSERRSGRNQITEEELADWFQKIVQNNHRNDYFHWTMDHPECHLFSNEMLDHIKVGDWNRIPEGTYGIVTAYLSLHSDCVPKLRQFMYSLK